MRDVAWEKGASRRAQGRAGEKSDFFNSLLVQLPGDRVCLEPASGRKSATLTVFFDQLFRE